MRRKGNDEMSIKNALLLYKPYGVKFGLYGFSRVQKDGLLHVNAGLVRISFLSVF